MQVHKIIQALKNTPLFKVFFIFYLDSFEICHRIIN